MITIISGTNRKNSISIQVAKQYQAILSELGTESTIVDLEQLPADFIATALYENQGNNAEFNPTRMHMKEAQKYVFIVPEYNRSYPGVLKTFLDALEFPGTLKGKKCALVGISSGIQGGVMAMSHLTDIFNYLGMHVLALKPKLNQINGKIKDGKITDELFIRLIREQAEAIVSF